MATIQSSIQLFDGMTPVLRKITNSINTVISSFESMERASGHAFDTAELQGAREQLIQDVWGYDFYGDDRTLDTHIKLLRKSLQDYSRLIITLRGVGYRFEAEK